jgi:hypothetical protein
VAVVEGDCFSTIATSVLGPVGSSFYDGHHGRQAQDRSLAVVEAVLSQSTLVIIDDTGWSAVANSVDSYMTYHPKFRLLFDLPSQHESDSR